MCWINHDSEKLLQKAISCENRYTERISFKFTTHMERHFLGLVLTLLPEGVLAIVCHHFVLEREIEIDQTLQMQIPQFLRGKGFKIRKYSNPTLWPVV